MNNPNKDKTNTPPTESDSPAKDAGADSQAGGTVADTAEASRQPDPVRRHTTVLLLVVALLFVWYVWADRVAPWTDQARVDAFIVAITPKVSGKVTAVNVVQDQAVKAGDVLVEIDPRKYELALERAEANLEIAGQETGADTAAIAAAEANLAEARAQLTNSQQDLTRVENIRNQDAGAMPEATLDMARSRVQVNEAKVANATADLEQAKNKLGQGGEENAKVRDATAALEQAGIDLADTKLYAPGDGGITNLEVEVGHYAVAGTPLMTFVSGTKVWVEAYLRENSLGNLRPGDRAEITLDMVPGKVWQGKVVSRGYAVQKPTQGTAGGLVTVKTNAGWLRDAQRFPVVIEIDDVESLRGYQIMGGQADVQVYTAHSNAILNALGGFWIRLMSWLSYAY